MRKGRRSGPGATQVIAVMGPFTYENHVGIVEDGVRIGHV